MRIFPSTQAAIVGGAAVAPATLAALSLVEWRLGLRLPLLVWVLVGITPMIVTTTDLRPLRDWRFGPLWVAKANQADRGPWLKRVGLYLVGNIVGLMILQLMGVKL